MPGNANPMYEDRSSNLAARLGNRTTRRATGTPASIVATAAMAETDNELMVAAHRLESDSPDEAP